jgi:hypothetical protein
MTSPVPEPDPADDSLLEVERRLHLDGWTGQFRAVDGAQLECLTCRKTFPAGACDADRVIRLEGASDPADMAIVVPVECPHCATRGTFVSNYGPEVTPEEADVLRSISRSPAEGSSPGNHR